MLELASQKLNVVEACSGIRSLLSLSFLSLIYAYFFDKKVWMRWALLFATIPIAIAANAMRVTLTGVLSEIRTDLAQGFFHTLEGWVLFLVALFLLVICHQLINRVYLDFLWKDRSLRRMLFSRPAIILTCFCLPKQRCFTGFRAASRRPCTGLWISFPAHAWFLANDPARRDGTRSQRCAAGGRLHHPLLRQSQYP